MVGGWAAASGRGGMTHAVMCRGRHVHPNILTSRWTRSGTNADAPQRRVVEIRESTDTRAMAWNRPGIGLEYGRRPISWQDVARVVGTLLIGQAGSVGRYTRVGRRHVIRLSSIDVTCTAPWKLAGELPVLQWSCRHIYVPR